MTANLTFYQDGIIQVQIDEVDSPLSKDRFRASEYTVQYDQLRPLTQLNWRIAKDFLIFDEIYSDDYLEHFEVKISLSRFSVEIFSNGILTLTISPSGAGMMLENTNFYHGVEREDEDDIDETFD